MSDDQSPLDDQNDSPETFDQADDAAVDEGQSQVNPLPQDNDTPFSLPDDPVSDAATEDIELQTERDRLDPTHQVTDTNLDSQEAYDEGLSGAAEAEEPNAGDAVVNYDPDKDQRKNA